MQAVLPVSGRPDMYMLPGFFLSIEGCRKLEMLAASSLSRQKIVAGAAVCKACLALEKVLTKKKLILKCNQY